MQPQIAMFASITQFGAIWNSLGSVCLRLKKMVPGAGIEPATNSLGNYFSSLILFKMYAFCLLFSHLLNILGTT